MFENRYPLFKSGRLLKNEMLNELRDFPREFVDIKFDQYSNGIISGCNIDIEDNWLVIKKGIIKYKNIIYMLRKDERIEYECNNKLTALKVKFISDIKHDDFIENSTEIYLDDNLKCDLNEIELCRFQLRTGARLRGNYIDFNDLSTEYDTVNIINVPYSTYGEEGLCPKILNIYGKELLKCKITEVWDIYFGGTCIQSKEPIEKEIITSYLSYKLNIPIKDYSNEELYYYLLEVLNIEKNNSGESGKQGRGRYKKILVD